MGIASWFFGFFLSLPVKYINVDFFGFRIEDAICCVLLFSFLLLRALPFFMATFSNLSLIAYCAIS